MAAALRVVVRQRQIETAVLIEIDELDAVRCVVRENHRRQRLDECVRAINEERVTVTRRAGDEVADVEVRQAVVVEIAPAGSDAVAVLVDAALARHVQEPDAALVSIQGAAAVIRDEKIEVAIAIEVGKARSDTAVLGRPRRAEPIAAK